MSSRLSGLPAMVHSLGSRNLIDFGSGGVTLAAAAAILPKLVERFDAACVITPSETASSSVEAEGEAAAHGGRADGKVSAGELGRNLSGHCEPPSQTLDFAGGMVGRLAAHVGRHVDSRANALVGAASTDVGHRLVDVLVGRLRGLLEERRGGHDLAGLAVAALGHVDRRPGLLHRMGARRREAFYGDDLIVRQPRPTALHPPPQRRSSSCAHQVQRR
jgi:hypothetical protein